MREAWQETWEVLWRSILILLGLFALSAVAFLLWLISSVYPWRKHNVPLHLGMTVAELGTARPGTYLSTGESRSLRPLRGVPPSELAVFTGGIRVSTPSGATVDLPFYSGYRAKSTDARSTDTLAEAAFPLDRRLDSSARALRADLLTHLIVPARVDYYHTLPEAASELANYTGGLSGHEYAGMAHYRWRVEFIRGRAVQIREWDEGD